MPLPPYSLRRNPRARSIILKAEPRRGLVLVLPPRATRAEGERALRERLDWALAALERLRGQGLLDSGPPRLPATLALPALGLSYAVLLLREKGPGPRLTAGAGKLFVRGREDAPGPALAALRAFVVKTARLYLPQRLRDLSRALGLPFAEARVRTQRQRWGSCSAGGNIQLNSKLLFLPPELVDYVLVHELCHTVHHNHGPKFHELLGRLSPEAKALEARLARAGRLVPAWMEASEMQEALGC